MHRSLDPACRRRRCEMRSACALITPALIPALLGAQASISTGSHSPRLVLEGPLEIGVNTIQGHGAPAGDGVYVELWRVPRGTTAAVSVASVPTDGAGAFEFPDVEVFGGEHFYVTLSRSWHFDRDGDSEGWGGGSRQSRDVEVSVENGALRLRLFDGDGDGHRDAWIQTFFDYAPALYRVIEVRLRNPALNPDWSLGIYWGSPWGQLIAAHRVELPVGMDRFETILAPMNVDEVRYTPRPVSPGLDGLWTSGELSNSLRLDPLEGLPQFDDSVDGLVFEIDTIRIREDYRLDFHRDRDLEGIRPLADIEGLMVENGFLNYRSSQEPTLFFDLSTGLLESAHFTHFVIGLEHSSVTEGPNSIGVLFRDADSGDLDHDDDGSLQLAEIPTSFVGRVDLSEELDAATIRPGEWTEDGGVTGLRFQVPTRAEIGDDIRIDYIGLTSATPFGPSAALFVPAPNAPPRAVITSDPEVAELTLHRATTEIMLDGSESSDGDDGTQGLSYRWDKIAGPRFGDSMDAHDVASLRVRFGQIGKYVYRLTVDDGQTVDATDSTEIVVNVHAPPPSSFLRGDVNTDGVALEIVDAVALVRSLFRGRTDELPCRDAADVDDDGDLDIRDVIAALRGHFFKTPPPAPFPACGVDPTDDELSDCNYPEGICGSSSVGWRELTQQQRKRRSRRSCPSRR